MAHRRSQPLLILSSLIFLHNTADSQFIKKCTVCEDGSPVPLRGQRIHLEPLLDVGHCAALDHILQFITTESELCETAQTLGPLCGCEITDPDAACFLCNHQGQIADLANKTLILNDLSGASLGPDLPEVAALIQVSCEVLQSALIVEFLKDDPSCSHYQLTYAEQCGCPNSSHMVGNSTSTNNGTDVVIPPTNNQTSNNPPNIEDPANSRPRCTLCGDGSPPPYPDLYVDNIGTISATCGNLDAFASTLYSDDSSCRTIQGISLYCGCPSPPPNSPCTFCPNGETVGKPFQLLNWLERWTWLSGLDSFGAVEGYVLNCIHLEYLVMTADRDEFDGNFDVVCMATQLRSYICGCSPDWRQLLLTWSYRSSGILSILGSIAIIWSVLRKQRNKTTTYHQLILSICCFDCVSSFFYILVGVMAPRDDGFYKSFGNDATCKAQAFMIQLGHQTSMFYNLCLSVYFLLVIVYNWKEHQFRSYIFYVHVLVILLGVSLALGALPFYGPQLGVCGILQPPARTVTWWPVSLLFTLPLLVVLFTLAGTTLTVCRKVYQQEKKALRWTMRKKTTAGVARRVFWQGFWYVMAFYGTVPFLLLSYYLRFKSPNLFWVLVLSAILGPSQGFMNSFVYFQRMSSSARNKNTGRSNTRSTHRRSSLIAIVMGVRVTDGSRRASITNLLRRLTKRREAADTTESGVDDTATGAKGTIIPANSRDSSESTMSQPRRDSDTLLATRDSMLSIVEEMRGGRSSKEMLSGVGGYERDDGMDRDISTPVKTALVDGLANDRYLVEDDCSENVPGSPSPDELIKKDQTFSEEWRQQSLGLSALLPSNRRLIQPIVQQEAGHAEDDVDNKNESSDTRNILEEQEPDERQPPSQPKRLSALIQGLATLARKKLSQGPPSNPRVGEEEAAAAATVAHLDHTDGDSSGHMSGILEHWRLNIDSSYGRDDVESNNKDQETTKHETS